MWYEAAARRKAARIMRYRGRNPMSQSEIVEAMPSQELKQKKVSFAGKAMNGFRNIFSRRKTF